MKKRAWLILAAFGFALLIAVMLYVSLAPAITKETFTFEYGQKISLSSEDLFPDSKIIPDQIDLDLSALKLEEEKKYPQIGTYTIPVTYHVWLWHQTEEIKVKIQDTTKPVFTKKTDEITLEEGEDDVNFSVYFKAEDLSKVSLVYVTDEVDYDTPGTYSAMVRAVDASGNISEQSFQIIVEEKEEPVSLITEEAQAVSDDSSLSSIINSYSGTIGIYYKNLKSGESYIYNDIDFYPCSVIKLCVLLTVYDQANRGNISLSQCQPYLKSMIIYSNNDSYNTLLQMLGAGDGLRGLEIVNEYLASIGISRTRIHHSLQPAAEEFGDGSYNVSCPSDIGILFEKLYRYELFSSQQSEEILSLLKQCADTNAIWQGLPHGAMFAHKTGWAYDLYLDGGIVYRPSSDYVLVIFTDNVAYRSSFFQEISSYFYYH